MDVRCADTISTLNTVFALRSFSRSGTRLRRLFHLDLLIARAITRGTGASGAGVHQAEEHEGGRERPRAFLKEVSCTLHSPDLLGAGKTGGQAAAFGVLGENDQGQESGHDDDEDVEEKHAGRLKRAAK